MKKILESDSPEAHAVREFLTQRMTGKIKDGMTEGYDISDPHGEDMTALTRGTYDLTHLVAVGEPGQEEFHCYIGPKGQDGKTELHIKRDSAAKVRKLLKDATEAD